MSFLGWFFGKVVGGFLIGLVKLFLIFRLGKSSAFRKIEEKTRKTQERMRKVKEPTSDEVTDALDRGEF